MSTTASPTAAVQTELPGRFAVLRGRIPMPWGTVIALAVVLAFADGFVVITMQGAVGAIERAQNPFGDWLTYSTVLVPVFALAVMWALARAHRRGRRTVTAVLVVAAVATAVGVAVLIANTAYNYHLQAELLAKTAGLHAHGVGPNDAANPAYADDGWSAELRQTVLVAVKADALGVALLIAGNLFLTGWITALRGGRLLRSR